MSPITQVTNATFDEISKEGISESFENNSAIQTVVFLAVSIVLFFTLPLKMLAKQKKDIQRIFKEDTVISSVALREPVEQTLLASSDNARSIQTTLM